MVKWSSVWNVKHFDDRNHGSEFRIAGDVYPEGGDGSADVSRPLSGSIGLRTTLVVVLIVFVIPIRE